MGTVYGRSNEGNAKKKKIGRMKPKHRAVIGIVAVLVILAGALILFLIGFGCQKVL